MFVTDLGGSIYSESAANRFLIINGLFMLWRFVWTAGLPASSHAPSIGDRAPEFTLLDDHRQSVSLASPKNPATWAP